MKMIGWVITILCILEGGICTALLIYNLGVGKIENTAVMGGMAVITLCLGIIISTNEK